MQDVERLKMIFDYWLHHNIEHIAESERWLAKVEEMGLVDVAKELEAVVGLSKDVSYHVEHARSLLEQHNRKTSIKQGKKKLSERVAEKIPHEHIELHPIGIIHTPYTDHAPRQPQSDAEGDFRIVIHEHWADGLYKLEKFKYICVFFCFHSSQKVVSTRVAPEGTSGIKVGVFASRSPVRPNPIGFSVVRIKRISGNTIYTTCIDVFDGTPLFDIKPYIGRLDCKTDANNGWIDELDDTGYLFSKRESP